jgi:hypothetical protein
VRFKYGDAIIKKVNPNVICFVFCYCSDCIEISERSVKSIVEHGKIKHLALSRCYGITPKSLE